MPTPPTKVATIPDCKGPSYTGDYRTPSAYHQDPGKGDIGDFTIPPVNPNPFGQTIAGKK